MQYMLVRSNIASHYQRYFTIIAKPVNDKTILYGAKRYALYLCMIFFQNRLKLQQFRLKLKPVN